MEDAWHKLDLAGKLYLFKLTAREGIVGYSCYLTDLVDLYQEQIDREGFCDKFSRVNSDLELDDIGEGFGEVISIMKAEEKARKVKGEIMPDSCDLQVEWISEGIPYKWIFHLVKGSSSNFHDVVTKSLLDSMAFLVQEKKELVNIIRSKDLELEDYENSGAKLTRKALKTTWFRQEEAFNEIKPVQLDDDIDFMTSPEIQNVMNKTVKMAKEDSNSKVTVKSADSLDSPKKEAKENTPKLDSKRKIVKPDLTKIADKMNNKKRKLNSL